MSAPLLSLHDLTRFQHGNFHVGVHPYVFHCFRRGRSDSRGYRMFSDSSPCLVVHHGIVGEQAKRPPLVYVTLETWTQGLAKITPGTVYACFGENQKSQLVKNQALCAFG